MDRNARALILALLCVLAVSLAAATLTNPQEPSGTGNGWSGPAIDETGNSPQDSDGEDSGTGVPEPDDGGEMIQIGPSCMPFLLSPTFGLLVGVFYLGLGGLLYRRDGIVPAILVLFVVSTILFPVWLIFTGCGSDAPTNQDGGIVPPLETGDDSDEETTGASGSEPMFTPPIMLAALAVVVVLLAAVAFRASGDDEPPEQTPVEEVPAEPDEEALGALGDVAGEAADRIAEDADVENEVYRAWREMTTHLDVPNPESSTPAEFAAAAEAVGMSDEHVTELTDLFREVRYGGAPATDEREQRAVDALRDIEATYGGDA